MSEKELQSILLENLEIRLPGLKVRRLGLNQHMPRVEKLSAHLHRHWQALLYLRGQGTQHLSESKFPIQRGSLLVVPPGERHRFVKSQFLRPVCLVIDFEIEIPAEWQMFTAMSDHDVKRIERLLIKINGFHKQPTNPSIPLAAFILNILGIIQRNSCSDSSETAGPTAERIEFFLKKGSTDLGDLSPARIAEQFQVSLDHLNRTLRSESSPSVGKLLASARLDFCCKLLKDSRKPVGEVAFQSGYSDQNYFARWFRKQTGQTPQQWRNAQSRH